MAHCMLGQPQTIVLYIGICCGGRVAKSDTRFGEERGRDEGGEGREGGEKTITPIHTHTLTGAHIGYFRPVSQSV